MRPRGRHLKNWPENSNSIEVGGGSPIFAIRLNSPVALHRNRRAFQILLLVALAVAGCAQRRPVATIPPPPIATPIPVAPPGTPPVLAPGYSEQGVASWYGLPFHGRKASSGEVFDMNQLVAAHRTLPFNSVVRVTNLNNGMQIDVRIIDRGPFVAGRVIDLSRAAATAINMIGTGIAPVRIELVSSAPTFVTNFSVQIGAFQESGRAEELRAQLAPRYPVYVQQFDSDAGHFYRVRVGHLATQQEAQQLAAKLVTEGPFQTFVVRLDGLQ